MCDWWLLSYQDGHALEGNSLAEKDRRRTDEGFSPDPAWHKRLGGE